VTYDFNCYTKTDGLHKVISNQVLFKSCNILESLPHTINIKLSNVVILDDLE